MKTLVNLPNAIVQCSLSQANNNNTSLIPGLCEASRCLTVNINVLSSAEASHFVRLTQSPSPPPPLPPPPFPQVLWSSVVRLDPACLREAPQNKLGVVKTCSNTYFIKDMVDLSLTFSLGLSVSLSLWLSFPRSLVLSLLVRLSV